MRASGGDSTLVSHELSRFPHKERLGTYAKSLSDNAGLAWVLAVAIAAPIVFAGRQWSCVAGILANRDDNGQG